MAKTQQQIYQELIAKGMKPATAKAFAASAARRSAAANAKRMIKPTAAKKS